MSKLTLDRVTKIYGEGENAVKALDDVSLQVKEGELVAIVGPSGSGKTTLLSIAGALLHPTEGAVLLNGNNITTFPAGALTSLRLQHIGFVLQSSNLMPYLTARDQLLLVLKLSGNLNKEAAGKADKLLGTLGLSKRLNHYPEELSGGERQRVAIARALINDPDVLLADEPTANLDSQRGREVVEMLAHEVKSRRKAALLVTHDERMLDLCDRVVRITDGRISELVAETH
ncbi:MAG TPA: ABC transporter ATP-binding protein [Chloroflexia bacterium]|nr:ABC transporter ATP-binding protein [Chloroflexia bacterium]